VHVTPVQCAWLNQVEPWFAIRQRKRLRIVDVASLADLQAKREQCIAHWNAVAHPFNGTTTSVATVMADITQAAAYNRTPFCVELYLAMPTFLSTRSIRFLRDSIAASCAASLCASVVTVVRT
jgi:hypothetical protein